MYTETIVRMHATLPNAQLLCLAARFAQDPSVATTLRSLGPWALRALPPRGYTSEGSRLALRPVIAERRLRRTPSLGQPTRLGASMLVMLE